MKVRPLAIKYANLPKINNKKVKFRKRGGENKTRRKVPAITIIVFWALGIKLREVREI